MTSPPINQPQPSLHYPRVADPPLAQVGEEVSGEAGDPQELMEWCSGYGESSRTLWGASCDGGQE